MGKVKRSIVKHVRQEITKRDHKNTKQSIKKEKIYNTRDQFNAITYQNGLTCLQAAKK